MKIFALSKPGTKQSQDLFQKLLKDESKHAWELYKEGAVREIYLRKDHPGVVVVLEAENIDAAESHLSRLPLYEQKLIGFDLIPVGPFTNFEQLFAPVEVSQ